MFGLHAGDMPQNLDADRADGPAEPAPRSSRNDPADRRRLPLGALLALSAAGFLTMLTETVPAGLLPQISTGLGVSPGRAGQLLSVYALGSMLAALPLTALTRGWPRRRLLLATTLVVAVVNLLTAVSSVYGLTVAARLVAGLAAGVQWAMIAGYAMRLVDQPQKGRALAVSMAGVPLGLALGVPAGTALGGMLGWRITFATVAALAVLVAGWALAEVPEFLGEAAADRLPVRRVFVLPGLPVILAAAFAFEVGHMNLYTYIAPLLDRAELAQHIELLLLVFGVAALAGLWVAGVLIDRHLRTVVLGVLALFAVCMLGFASLGQTGGVVVAAVAGWGLALGAAPTMFQAASAQAAGSAVDLAQAMLVTVLNAGMAAGAALGGFALGAGTGTLAWISLAIFTATLAAALLGRRHAFPPPDNQTPRRSDQLLSQPSPKGP